MRILCRSAARRLYWTRIYNHRNYLSVLSTSSTALHLTHECLNQQQPRASAATVFCEPIFTKPMAAFSTASSPVEEESFTTSPRKQLRNVAIIAHVDHGKTTLVDQLLQLGGNNREHVDRLLDSSDLERERGITITSKVTRITYRDDDDDDDDDDAGDPIVINCVDTPGHADFSAEVDRVLSMVDGVILVVDAAEGPKSQTKYVLTRALGLRLKPIVVLNKCDRADAIANIDSGITEAKLSDLFQALGAVDGYRTLYASARCGWVTEDPLEALELAEESDGLESDKKYSMKHLIRVILEEVPEPAIQTYSDDTAMDPFSMTTVNVGYDPYLGRTCTGRIVSGRIQVNDAVTLLRRDPSTTGDAAVPRSTVVSGVFVHQGIRRVPIDGCAMAGDIVTLAGIPDSIAVGDTLTSTANPVPHPIDTPPLAPPTLAMDFGPNDGPLAGLEGTKIASSQIRDRLISETDNNVTLIVEPSKVDTEKTTVYARGELQLGILIESLRREGFEMVISPPQILTKECVDTGKVLEPFEEVMVDVDTEHASTVVSALTGDRRGVLLESTISSDDKTRLLFEVPTRGLLGFQSEVATSTRGSAVVNHLFLEYREFAGSLGIGLEKGKLVSTASGKATAFALGGLSQRGVLFIEAGEPVYPGMVIGQNAKTGDMEVNAVKEKEKSNMRTQAKDEKIHIPPPKRYRVEELIGYMQRDELIEVTPKSVRLRKQFLDASTRERAARTKAKQLRSSREAKQP